VADEGVAGVPDADWGGIVTAFVVLRPGQSVDIEELRRHCGGTLAAHKHPRRLVLVAAIPRTGPTGQVQRRRLVELAQAVTSGPTGRLLGLRDQPAPNSSSPT
jgi:acyl-coenzyme A synthetase/AMP-(fatty) acid ligase